MNCSLPQRLCSAQTKEVGVGNSLYMFGIPCVIKTHPAWFRLSLISISWLAFPSHHQIELLQNPGRIHRTSGGSVWVGGSSGDNAISISKARCDFKWSVLLCKIRSDFWTTKPSQKLHEVFKWRVFWRIENKKPPRSPFLVVYAIIYATMPMGNSNTLLYFFL